jgi:hypothetical protein
VILDSTINYDPIVARGDAPISSCRIIMISRNIASDMRCKSESDESDDRRDSINYCSDVARLDAGILGMHTMHIASVVP